MTFIVGGTTTTCPGMLQKLSFCPMGWMGVTFWETVMTVLAALPSPSGQFHDRNKQKINKTNC